MVKIFQQTETEDPTQPKNVVNKRYVDNLLNAASPVFITNAEPGSLSSGLVGTKVYVPNTVPTNAVLDEATTDDDSVRIELVAEGPATFYSPTVELTGSPALPSEPISVPLTESGTDKRFFSGAVDVTVTATTTITATSSTGATTTVIINRASAGPAITDLVIGSLPIGVNSGLQQTEVKAGDIVPVGGTVENDATAVEILATGASGSVSAMSLGAVDSGGIGFRSFSGTFTVGAGSGLLGVTARAQNSFGTFGSNFNSTNQITLNQTFPTIAVIGLTYPVGQQGLKNSETVDASSTVTDFDIISYTTSSDLSVPSPASYSATKTVTRIDGDYVFGVNNYTITAIKASNDALSTRSAQVTIANIAPTAALSIDGSPTRLRSSASGESYTVRLDPNQTLLQSPDALVADQGDFSGSWSPSTGDNWIKTIIIRDTDLRGIHTFNSMVITGLAGITGSVITAGSNYEIGGFTLRTITYASFQQASDIGTFVSDVTKLVASYTGSSALTFQPNLNDQVLGFSVADRINDDLNAVYDPTNRYLWINDVAYAGANVSGTLQVDVEETA